MVISTNFPDMQRQTDRAPPAGNRPRPVLEFRDVTLHQAGYHVETLRDLTFSVNESDLMLVRLEEGRDHLPLASAVQGLIGPERGRVLFDGEDWETCSDPENERRRARIGRVFNRQGWISNLSIMENVTLAQRHHSSTPEDELRRRAVRWAQRFHLEAIPSVRPAFVPVSERRRLEWVRGFYGEPRLLLLEQPMDGVPEDFLPSLMEGVDHMRENQVAVVWLTEHDDVWQRGDLTGARRYIMRGSILQAAEEVSR